MPVTSRRCLAFLVVVTALACAGESPSLSATAPNAPSPPSTRVVGAQEVRSSNPFAVWAMQEGLSESEESCVLAVLHLKDVKTQELLEGNIELRNRCPFAVAVLTSPAEVRTRTRPENMLRWEGMAGPYVILYIYRRELGRPKLDGDAGAPILGLPKYVVVEANSSSMHPLVGGRTHALSRGEYGSFVQTWAVRTTIADQAEGRFDLSESVARHNAENAGKAEQTVPARELMAVYSRDAFFRVE